MIVREFYKVREDGVDLYITKSTEGLQIRKVGTDEIYDEAIDVATSPHYYVETQEKIETKEQED
jgi:hypothetical protein